VRLVASASLQLLCKVLTRVARGKKCHDLNEFLQRASGHLEVPDTVIRLNRLHEDVIEEEAKSEAAPGSGVWNTGMVVQRKMVKHR
jgi:hypothetical protein